MRSPGRGAPSLTLLGEVDRAIQDLDEALQLDPRYTPAFLARGEAHARAGRHARALEDYAVYITAAPEDAYARFRRGLSFSRLNQNENAIGEFGEAIRLDARLVSAYLERGRLYATAGQHDRAIVDFGEAVGLAPRFAPAHNELAWLLATSSREHLRDGRRAVEHARTAAELSGWKNVFFLDTYAAALAEAGEFAEAVKWQLQAMERFTGNARTQAEARLNLYREGKPFRGP